MPKYLFVMAVLALCLYACKKDKRVSLSAPIAGRWYQNKLAINQQTIKTGAIASATYPAMDFDTTYYWQFNNDNTAFVSSGATIFTVNGKSSPLNGNGQPLGGKGYYRWYKVSGSSLILQLGFIPTCMGCSQPGPDTVKILQLDANNLVLHEQLDTSSVYKVTTDSYYTRGH
ncbi:hypothetical protein [Mucilaginibacter sp.]|uniref:hypothetical protein n=1 Tax=Mucilaginibacter sp. TaxID=1882438 RepID=UPI00284E15C0|nr:hypothetical protein [Mucilaginibacter sp.]MDR3694662.1 hypothetical protein [Mucilaginibacter sp.]